MMLHCCKLPCKLLGGASSWESGKALGITLLVLLLRVLLLLGAAGYAADGVCTAVKLLEPAETSRGDFS